MIRLIILAIPLFFIYLFINEYLKQKRQAEENWNNQWEEKKKNFQNEQELLSKEREIQKLRDKLRQEKHQEEQENPNPPRFSNN